jgi:hypothetical protein
MKNDIELLMEKYDEVVLNEKLADVFGNDKNAQDIILDIKRFFGTPKNAPFIIQKIQHWLNLHPNKNHPDLQNIQRIINNETPEHAITDIQAAYAHSTSTPAPQKIDSGPSQPANGKPTYAQTGKPLHSGMITNTINKTGS